MPSPSGPWTICSGPTRWPRPSRRWRWPPPPPPSRRSAPASSSCPCAVRPPWPSRPRRSRSSPVDASSSGSASASTRASTTAPASSSGAGDGSWTWASTSSAAPGTPTRLPPRTTSRQPASASVPIYDRRLERGRQAEGGGGGRRLDPPLPHARGVQPALAELRRETAEAGRDPDAVEPAVVVFACVGDDDGAHERGAAGSRTCTGCRPRRSGGTWCPVRAEDVRRRLDRFADAGARHIVVMVAGSPALEHFVPLRRAFTDASPAGVLAGAPA